MGPRLYSRSALMSTSSKGKLSPNLEFQFEYRGPRAIRNHCAPVGGEGGRQIQLLKKPSPAQAPQPCTSVRAPEEAASAQCTGKGVMKEQGQLQNCFLSKALPTTFCREVPEPFVWIQCFSLSLEASGQGEGKGGIGRRGRELSLVLATARGNVFSLKNLNHLQIRQTAQHAHEHTCTCTLVSKQPTATATATSPNHLRTPSFHSKRVCLLVPQIPLIQGRHNSLCKSTFLRAANPPLGNFMCPHL